MTRQPLTCAGGGDLQVHEKIREDPLPEAKEEKKYPSAPKRKQPKLTYDERKQKLKVLPGGFIIQEADEHHLGMCSFYCRSSVICSILGMRSFCCMCRSDSAFCEHDHACT